MDGLQSVVIKVSPEALAGKAGDVLNRISAVEKRFDRIESSIKRSSDYWCGEAGETHRAVYQDCRTKIEETLGRFRETAEILEEIAQNYISNETSAEGEADGLPTDVIV